MKTFLFSIWLFSTAVKAADDTTVFSSDFCEKHLVDAKAQPKAVFQLLDMYQKMSSDTLISKAKGYFPWMIESNDPSLNVESFANIILTLHMKAITPAEHAVVDDLVKQAKEILKKKDPKNLKLFYLYSGMRDLSSFPKEKAKEMANAIQPELIRVPYRAGIDDDAQYFRLLYLNSQNPKVTSTVALDSAKSLYTKSIEARKVACESFQHPGVESYRAKRNDARSAYIEALKSNELAAGHQEELLKNFDQRHFSYLERKEAKERYEKLIKVHREFEASVTARKNGEGASIFEIGREFRFGDSYLGREYQQQLADYDKSPLAGEFPDIHADFSQMMERSQRLNFSRFHKENQKELEDELYENMCQEKSEKEDEWRRQLKGTIIWPSKSCKSYYSSTLVADRYQEFIKLYPELKPVVDETVAAAKARAKARFDESESKERPKYLAEYAKLHQRAHLTALKAKANPTNVELQKNAASLAQEDAAVAGHMNLSFIESTVLHLGTEFKASSEQLAEQKKEYAKAITDLQAMLDKSQKEFQAEVAHAPVSPTYEGSDHIAIAKSSPAYWRNHVKRICQEQGLMQTTLSQLKSNQEVLESGRLSFPSGGDAANAHGNGTVPTEAHARSQITVDDPRYQQNYYDCLGRIPLVKEWTLMSRGDMETRYKEYRKRYESLHADNPEDHRDNCDDLISRWKSRVENLDGIPPVVIGMGGFGERYSKRIRMLRDFKNGLKDEGYSLNAGDMNALWDLDNPGNSLGLKSMMEFERHQSLHPFRKTSLEYAGELGGILDDLYNRVGGGAVDSTRRFFNGKPAPPWSQQFQQKIEDVWANSIDKNNSMLGINMLWDAEKKGAETLGFEYDEPAVFSQCVEQVSKIEVTDPRTGKTVRPKIILTGFSTGAADVLKHAKVLTGRGVKIEEIFAVDPVDPILQENAFMGALKAKLENALAEKADSITGGRLFVETALGRKLPKPSAAVAASAMIAPVELVNPRISGHVHVYHEDSDRDSVPMGFLGGSYAGGLNGGFMRDLRPGDTDRYYSRADIEAKFGPSAPNRGHGFCPGMARDDWNTLIDGYVGK